MMLLEVQKVRGSLACAGKVRGQTQNVAKQDKKKMAKQDKKKKPRGRARKRMQYTSAWSRPDSFDLDARNEPSIDQDIEMGTQVTRSASDLGMDSFNKQMDHVVAKKKEVLEATLTELDLLCTHHEIEPGDAQTKLLFCILFQEEP